MKTGMQPPHTKKFSSRTFQDASSSPALDAVSARSELIPVSRDAASLLVIHQSASSVAVRIVEDETTVFAYKMEGATLEADWWMTNKLAASSSP